MATLRLLSQGFDRLEPAGAVGRDDAGDQPDGDRQAHAQPQGLVADAEAREHRPEHGGEQRLRGDRQPDPQQPAQRAEQQRLEDQQHERRAVGEAQAARIQAEADRQKVELVATAQREAEIIRGEGEAERNKVFAQAFEKDAEFFAFYRTMKAYEKSLSDSDTTLVLTPDSEFFKFFGKSDSVSNGE